MNFLNLLSTVVYAEGEAQASVFGGGMGMFGSFIPLIVIIVVFYLMLIRPQRKKEKALKEMIAALKVGDEVVTVGGLHGKIVRVKDETFVIESGMGANKSTIKIERSAVSRVTKQKDSEDRYAPPVEEPEENEPENTKE